MTRIIAMMGLPRSGKSTLAERAAAFQGWPIVRRDAIRLAMHGQRFAKEAEPLVKAFSELMIKSLFLAGHKTVLVDETNFSFVARESLRRLADDVLFWVVPTDAETCIQRAKDTNQRDLIPVIQEMSDRYEPLVFGELEYQP